MWRGVVGLGVVVCLCVGCDKQETPKAKEKGVEVNAPGVNVKVDKKGADVKFPGGEVKVKD